MAEYSEVQFLQPLTALDLRTVKRHAEGSALESENNLGSFVQAVTGARFAGTIALGKLRFVVQLVNLFLQKRPDAFWLF